MKFSRLTALVAVPLLLSCGPDFTESGLGTSIDFEPDRPEIPRSETVAPYQGTDSYVLDAQERYRTGLDVHRKVIWRTCTPFDGVCHNTKEYPDLHTPSNFLATINAPCNVVPGEWESVYDRCEQEPDQFEFNRGDLGGRSDVGWIDFVQGEYPEYSEGNPPTVDSPGVHVVLRDKLDTERSEFWANGQFWRTLPDGERIVFARYETRWWIIDDENVAGTHLVAEVRNYQTDTAQELPNLGIKQGDLNRNGEFGSDEGTPIPMIAPGDPEGSYLVGRMRGEMHGESVPGSRMPLANQPLDIPDMLALFCFIEGLPADGSDPDMSAPVNFKDCSYSADPANLNLLGEGVTWETRISKILEANCGGCHGGASPDADLNLLEGAYEALLQPSIQKPELNLVEPGDYENSYLWHKLNNDPDIVGLPMPYNPLTGEGRLSEAELGDIQTWIAAGAVENE